MLFSSAKATAGIDQAKSGGRIGSALALHCTPQSNSMHDTSSAHETEPERISFAFEDRLGPFKQSDSRLCKTAGQKQSPLIL